MIRSISTTEDILATMAYTREEFKNRVEEKVGGALLEHYKAALSTLHGHARWVQHWQSEADRLINSELVVVLLHSIKGFRDRQKAAGEVIEHLRSIDHQYRRAAERIVKRDFGLKKLRIAIPDEVATEFYDNVQRVIDTHA